jgi:hypothetical protein
LICRLQELIFGREEVGARMEIDAPEGHRLMKLELPVAPVVFWAGLSRHQEVVSGATFAL